MSKKEKQKKKLERYVDLFAFACEAEKQWAKTGDGRDKELAFQKGKKFILRQIKEGIEYM